MYFMLSMFLKRVDVYSPRMKMDFERLRFGCCLSPLPLGVSVEILFTELLNVCDVTSLLGNDTTGERFRKEGPT